jgi:hypothetical protein
MDNRDFCDRTYSCHVTRNLKVNSSAGQLGSWEAIKLEAIQIKQLSSLIASRLSGHFAAQNQV